MLLSSPFFLLMHVEASSLQAPLSTLFTLDSKSVYIVLQKF